MTFDITPEQYHAGLTILWNAMPDLNGPQDQSVFELAAQRIKELQDKYDTLKTEYDAILSDFLHMQADITDANNGY